MRLKQQIKFPRIILNHTIRIPFHTVTLSGPSVPLSGLNLEKMKGLSFPGRPKSGVWLFVVPRFLFPHSTLPSLTTIPFGFPETLGTKKSLFLCVCQLVCVVNFPRRVFPLKVRRAFYKLAYSREKLRRIRWTKHCSTPLFEEIFTWLPDCHAREQV